MAWFYFDVIDEVTGARLMQDIEVDVTANVTLVGGDPEIEIDDIKVDGHSLAKGGHYAKWLLGIAMNRVEEEIAARGHLYHELIDDAGLVFHGPAGSPDAYWGWA